MFFEEESLAGSGEGAEELVWAQGSIAGVDALEFVATAIVLKLLSAPPVWHRAGTTASCQP